MNTTADTRTISNHHKTIPSKPIAITCLLATLTACTAIPPKAESHKIVAQPQIPIDQPYRIYDANTTSTAQASIASQRWQQFYTDTKLKQLIQMALDNNKDLQSALLAIESAKAQYQITDISTTPKLNASGGYSRSANNAADKNPGNAYNVGLGMASYEIDFWGRIADLKDQALQNYLATTAGKDTAQIALISKVAQTYVNLSYAKAQLNLANATIQSRQKSLTIAKARFDAGIDSKSPSLQAAASLENAKLAAYQAKTRILKLRNALQYLIGQPVPDNLLPTPAVTNMTTPKIFGAGLPSELLHYRPDILQAEYSLKAAGANIDAARAAYFPSISLTGSVGLSSTDLDNLFKSSSLGWSFGPSIRVPIFDAGQLDANYQVAKIQREQALTSYEKKIQTAFKEVSDVLADRATIEQQLASQYSLQDNFEQTYNIANARYKAGLDNYLSVLDAERSRFSAQQSIYNLEQAKMISQIQLYQTLGGGADLDVPVQLNVPYHDKLVSFIDPNNKIVDTKGKASSSILDSDAHVATPLEIKEALNN